MAKNKSKSKKDEELEKPQKPEKKKNHQRGKQSKAAAAADDDDDESDHGGGAKTKKLKAAHQIKVRHILCEKHSKMLQAKEKLQEGVAFDEVAREFSEDKARQGGSLGLKTRDALVPEFAEVAFELEPSSCSDPICGEAKSEFGYHIIMVEQRL